MAREIKKAKQPYFLHMPDRMVFAFAGVMSRWKGLNDEPRVLTAAIITRAAEGAAADVHTRMPLILPKDAEAAWLDRGQVAGAKALEAANDAAVTAVELHAVSTRVNNSRNAGADLIEPFSNPDARGPHYIRGSSHE
ncbi:MAG: SOS response-associated peptidase family protein [Nitrospirota bacterium]